MTATETFEPADFSAINLGDRVRFVTADNGYGGSGDGVWRTGTVTKVTTKTITVACDGNWMGATAVLRRATWNYRAVSRAAAKRTPYNAESVAIVDDGHTVAALYIPNPDDAKNPQLVWGNIADRRYEFVEVVATMKKISKNDGAEFTGWIVQGADPYNYSEPIATKSEALRQLRTEIADYFTAPTASAPKETPAMPETAHCTNHHVTDERGAHADALPVPACESGVTYGIWNENDGGFVHSRDCALQAANDAAEFLADDSDGEYRILAVCRTHEDQPADTCEDCNAEDEDYDEGDQESEEPSAEVAVTAQPAIEGVIVTHTGTALGSMPEHADNPDVRAAIAALDPLKPAELTGHELKDNPDASGFMVEPREDGNVAVYWLEDGSYRTAKGSIRHTEVTMLATKLRAAGWTVRPGRSACVFAHTPPPMNLDGAIKQLAYELTLPGVQRNNELVIAHAEEIIRLAHERNYQASI
jgi:hypothetical protein